MPYDLFLSYARKDDANGQGWVSALHRELQERHQRHSGRRLGIFFDTHSIEGMEDWRRKILMGLRASKLFLACLTPNYLASDYCLQEWEEYLRREHSAARGDDGITPIYFVRPDELTAGDDQHLAAWLGDLKRRHRDRSFELHSWFSCSPQILQQSDPSSPAIEPAGAPTLTSSPTELSERLDALDRRIASRLDQIILAEIAPGNLMRNYEHFVGRHRELSELHDALVAGRRGLIAAAHGLGGQGKTALALQYAHAYAQFYAGGGRWLLRCEGQSRIGDVLARLADERELELELTESERSNADLAASAVLDHLRKFTRNKAVQVCDALRRSPDRHSADVDLPKLDHPRCLLILDNVDDPALLSADQIALIPATEWLEIVVTTRLNPERFGAGDRWQKPISVDELPEPDALALLCDFQPEHRFVQPDDQNAAWEIVHALGGYTLAVELVGAYLGMHPGVTAVAYLQRLIDEGLTTTDDLAHDPDVERRIHHRQKQLALVVKDTLGLLSEAARTVLHFASLLPPDQIPLIWLHDLTGRQHKEILTERAGYPPAWPAIWHELEGLRLLTSADDEIPPYPRRRGTLPTMARLHRLIGEHCRHYFAADEVKALGKLGRFLQHRVTSFASTWKHDPSSIWELAPLRECALRLLRERETWLTARLAAMLADAEAAHGQIDSAIAMLEPAIAFADRGSRNEADGAGAAWQGTLAAHLGDLGKLLIRRGRAADYERAQHCFDRSVTIQEQMLLDAPNSYQGV